MLKLYNTLTNRVEEFQPLNPQEARMYVCGPTVYDYAHIGNFRTFLFADLLRRYIKYKGYRLRHVMNITDVDDKIIERAVESGKPLREFTDQYIRFFFEDFDALGAERPEEILRATDHIPEMVELIDRLGSAGHTYQSEGSTYFRIASFEKYGRLSKMNFEGVVAGGSERVDADEYDKENVRDFVLWKAKEDEPAWAQWDAPFGRGRPGWHIECSAMGMKYLGETLDIHCGGVDLIFPHHENEIAQSTCGTGQPFVRHWVHIQHLLVDNETMSKSKGNFFTIPDVLARGHRPDALRYLLCAAHYRSLLNFTWESLDQAAAALERIHGLAQRLAEVEKEGPVPPRLRQAVDEADAAFDAALSDDLNTPEALAAVHGLVAEANAVLASGEMTREGAALVRAELESMDGVFAVLLPAAEERLSPEEQALFDERQEARRQRDFARADAARRRLEELGIVLEDTPKGTRWRRKR